MELRVEMLEVSGAITFSGAPMDATACDNGWEQRGAYTQLYEDVSAASDSWSDISASSDSWTDITPNTESC